MIRFQTVGLGIALSLLLSTQAGAQTGASTDDGRALAIKACASCHLVAPDQPKPPAHEPPAPSFAWIANRPGTTAPALRRFVLAVHDTLKSPPDSPPTSLSDAQAVAIADYIVSLRKQP